MFDGKKDEDKQEHVEDDSATVAGDGSRHSMQGSEVFRAGPFDLCDRLCTL